MLAGAVPAHDAVPSEDPEVAALRYNVGPFLRLWYVVLAGELVLVERFAQGGDEAFYLVVSVAGQLQRDLAGVNVCEYVREHFLVDLAQLRDPVVCCEVCVFLGLAGVVLIVHRGLGQPFELSGQKAAVSLHYEA